MLAVSGMAINGIIIVKASRLATEVERPQNEINLVRNEYDNQKKKPWTDCDREKNPKSRHMQ